MNFFEKAFRGLSCRLKILFMNSNENRLYKYALCKNCKRCIRLPKNKGLLIVTCPNCGEISRIET